MAIMQLKSPDTISEKDKGILIQIGLDSSEVCISMKEFVSVGIMVKMAMEERGEAGSEGGEMADG